MNITEWNAISKDDFDSMQFDSGVLVSSFDPATFKKPENKDVLDVTSGNISVTLTPTIVDLSSDVNNIHGLPPKELQLMTGWGSLQLSYTSLDFSASALKRSLAAADVSGNKVTPRMYLKAEDFETIAWVGKLVGGGLAAIVIKNSLSTGGLSITTSKAGKGTHSVTISGFGSIENPSEVPVEFYSIAADAA